MSIPKIFHAFWGGPPMPEHLRDYLRRWEALHPDWDLRVHTPGTLPELRNQDLFDQPEKYSPASNPWQWKSDLARYELLYDVGGVYIDADLEPLKRIDPLLEGAQAVAAREDRVYINNAFLGSVRRGRYIEAILAGLRRSVLAQPRARVNRQIGAHYITRVARRTPGSVRILDTGLIYPLHWSELDQRDTKPVGEAYTRHHWWNKTQLTEKGEL
jgi:mannosyltransferase OCH1-like enzyme